MGNIEEFNQNKMFKKYTNACVCNVKAAVRLYDEKQDPSFPPLLAYLCQGHACAKQIQLLAGLTEVNQYDDFYAAFILLNNTFMRFASTGHNEDDIHSIYDAFMRTFSKLNQ